MDLHCHKVESYFNKTCEALDMRDLALSVDMIQSLIRSYQNLSLSDSEYRILYLDAAQRALKHAQELCFLSSDFYYFKGICDMQNYQFGAAFQNFQIALTAFQSDIVYPHVISEAQIRGKIREIKEPAHEAGLAALAKVKEGVEDEVSHFIDAVNLFDVELSCSEFGEQAQLAASLTEICINKSRRIFKDGANAVKCLRELEGTIGFYNEGSKEKLLKAIENLSSRKKKNKNKKKKKQSAVDISSESQQGEKSGPIAYQSQMQQQLSDVHQQPSSIKHYLQTPGLCSSIIKEPIMSLKPSKTLISAGPMDCEKSLYLRVLMGSTENGSEHAWYRADLKEKRLIPVANEDSIFPGYGVACVFSGSKLYLIGGVRGKRDIVNEVFFIDTQNPQQGWAMAAPLQCPRELGSAIVADGKIYVFGGAAAGRGEENHLVEVYDPSTNSWDLVPPPPFSNITDHYGNGFVCTSFPVQLDYERSRFLIKITYINLIAYYFKEKRWELLKTEGKSIGGSTVIMDDVLFSVGVSRSFKLLQALDVKRDIKLDVVWSSEFYSDPSLLMVDEFEWCSALLQWGNGKLCLVCAVATDPDDIPPPVRGISSMTLCLLIIKVERTGSQIQFSLDSYHQFRLDGARNVRSGGVLLC